MTDKDGKVDDGGPAFPMSLRDYFAAKALSFLLDHQFMTMMADDSQYREIIAKKAYQIADAMIAERKKEPRP